MKNLFPIIAIITLGFLSVSDGFAARYSKKKPKISEMMLGGANNSAQTPTPTITQEVKPEAPPSKDAAPDAAPESEKKAP